MGEVEDRWKEWRSEVDQAVQQASEKRRPTPRQREVLELIYGHYRFVGEGCPVRYIARRLDISHTRAQRLVARLVVAGWVRIPRASRGLESYPVPSFGPPRRPKS